MSLFLLNIFSCYKIHVLQVMKTYIFKTKLLNNKVITREIETTEGINLYKLAEAVVGSYDFDFDHAFGFYSNMKEDYFKSERMYELFADLKDEEIEPTNARSVEKTKIGEVWKKVGDKMMFLFDYGDGWQFAVELSGFSEKQPKTKYPRILKSVGKAPEQYPDYEEEDEK